MITTATIMGINRHRPLAAAFAAEAVVNVGLSIAFIGPLGLAGVALGAVIPSLCVSLVFMPMYLKRQLGVPINQFLARLYVLPSLACAGFGVGTWVLERWMPAESLLSFFLQTALLLPLVVPGALLLVFSREERRELLAMVAGLRRKPTRSSARAVDFPLP